MKSSMLSSSALLLASAAALAGCEEDLLANQPDAAVDVLPLPEGDFGCVDVPRTMTAKDPLPVNGQFMDWDGIPLPGAAVSIYDANTDALITQATTNSAMMSLGRYSVLVPTGGQARAIYRKFEISGQLDAYAYDPWPQFHEFRYSVTTIDQAKLDSFYQMAGMTPDPAKGAVWIQAVDCKTPIPDGYRPWGPEGVTNGAKNIAGATFDGPPGSRVLYADAAGPPNAELTETESVWGGALIVGVPPGMTDIVVHAGPITYRSWPVMVRANTLTWTVRHP